MYKETKIIDLIPKGYKYDENEPFVDYSEDENAGFVQITIKKIVKDWNCYINNYFQEDEEDWKLCYWISGEDKKELLQDLTKEREVPFEISLGLLKFICDDLNVSFMYVLNGLTTNLVSLTMDKIKNCCTTQFLLSIKNKLHD